MQITAELEGKPGDAFFMFFGPEIKNSTITWRVDGLIVMEWVDILGELYTMSVDDETTRALNG